MNKEKSIGIGCFNFGIKKNIPFEFIGSEYLLELNKALSKISSLTNLKIEADDDFKNNKINIVEEIENLEEDEGHFPYTMVLNIEFDLYIPFRIQAKITECEEKRLSTFTENFNVKVTQSYYAPVAIIESINPSEENDPSSAVRIVREFIRMELTEDKSNYIRFECLGPSPFHFNCFIKPKKPEDDNDWLFDIDEELKKGYDNLFLYYNSDEIRDSEEALEYLTDSIQDEFGFFYHSIQRRNSKIHFWAKIQENLNSLIEIQNKKGIKGIFKRLLSRPRLIGKLFTDVATFEANDIFQSSLQQNEYNQTFSVKEEIFFKSFIDRELEEKIEYPVKQTAELVKFFENRRVKSLEIITTIAAAILGGAIGTILTISLQTRQIQNHNQKKVTSEHVLIKNSNH